MLRVHYLIIGGDSGALRVTESDLIENSHAWDVETEIHREDVGGSPISVTGGDPEEYALKTFGFRHLSLSTELDEDFSTSNPIQWGKGMHLLAWDVAVGDIEAARVGAGRSDHLAQIEAYGTSRDIADLDAIRGELDVHEMILIGQGAGAELAARYLSRYPERVRRAVFHSPTPLSNEAIFETYARTASPTGSNSVMEPRQLLAAAFTPYGPQAAQKIASQEEMRVLLEQAFDPRTWVCAADADQAPPVNRPSFNAYVELRAEITERALPDPRPRLAENLTPTLVLAGECDYLPWEVIREYQDALLNETVCYFEGAGHMIHLTRAELMADVIGAFLLDAPFPVEPFGGPENPRPSLGP